MFWCCVAGSSGGVQCLRFPKRLPWNSPVFSLDVWHLATLRTLGTPRQDHGRHPYARIAAAYALAPGHFRPKLLGLTASPGETLEQTRRLLEQLQATSLKSVWNWLKNWLLEVPASFWDFYASKGHFGRSCWKWNRIEPQPAPCLHHQQGSSPVFSEMNNIISPYFAQISPICCLFFIQRDSPKASRAPMAPAVFHLYLQFCFYFWGTIASSHCAGAARWVVTDGAPGEVGDFFGLLQPRTSDVHDKCWQSVPSTSAGAVPTAPLNRV